MRTQWLKIELQSELVLTRNAVTEGGHETLDYIPGSALLGAVSRHYAALGHEVFWSGKVRFGNGYLLGPGAGEELLWPAPLTYMRAKAGDSTLHNGLLQDPGQAGLPLRQVRQGYVRPQASGACFIGHPATRFRMKTAVDRQRFGAAREEQLFGYQSLAAGQCFAARLEADDDFSADKFQQISGCLQEPGIRLGRSRSAEYGLVSIVKMDCPPLPAPMADARLLVFYLASDYAPSGHPFPAPGHSAPARGSLAEAFLAEAAGLGLPGLQFDCARSQVRSRTCWPWNRYHDSPGMERHVLCAGSVIVAAAPTPPPSQEILCQWQTALDSGIGLWRQEGLGRVLVNPSLVLDPPRSWASPAPGQGPPSEAVEADPATLCSPLLQLVERRFLEAEGEILARAEARRLAGQWMAHTNRLSDMEEPFPGRSQWSALRQLARQLQDHPGDLDSQLEKFFAESLRRQAWRQADTRTDLASQVLAALRARPERARARLLYHAAHEMYCRLGHD